MAASTPVVPTDDITPLSTLLSPSRAHHLVTTHLLNIFSKDTSAPNPATNREIYADLYTEDVVFCENDGGTLHGHEGVEKLVERLVGSGGQFEGWKFVVKGNLKLNGDFIWVAWGFGPPEGGEVSVQVTGADAILLEKGEDGKVRIKKAYVIIDGLSDVATK